eukprot:scaffold1138_cov128-Cylindrotheca_fusiformis.AAC.26
MTFRGGNMGRIRSSHVGRPIPLIISFLLNKNMVKCLDVVKAIVLSRLTLYGIAIFSALRAVHYLGVEVYFSTLPSNVRTKSQRVVFGRRFFAVFKKLESIRKRNGHSLEVY